MRRKFKTADEAFAYLYEYVSDNGEEFDNTIAMFDVGVLIENPMSNAIHTPYRMWNPNYAEREWAWYLSGDPSAKEIARFAPIWYDMMDEDGNVRSNYGWQWRRSEQLDKVIELLSNKPNTRKAAISIYDGKEIDTYSNDTPCTYAVQFTILHGKLNMSVYMRSNDLWYGFCNDQYCFSMLQGLVAFSLGIEVGTYYHHAHNMHIYNDKLNLDKLWKKHNKKSQ